MVYIMVGARVGVGASCIMIASIYAIKNISIYCASACTNLARQILQFVHVYAFTDM